MYSGLGGVHHVIDLVGHVVEFDLVQVLELRHALADADAHCLKVGESRDCILGSPEYVAELGTLKRLDDARWIQWDRDLAHFSTARWLASQVHPDSIWLRTSHMGAQVEAAGRGVGLMLAPEAYEGVHGLVPVSLSRTLARSLAPFETHQLWLVGHRALRYVPRIAVVW